MTARHRTDLRSCCAPSSAPGICAFSSLSATAAPADCAVLSAARGTHTLAMSNINIQPDNMNFMIFPDRGISTPGIRFSASPEREISSLVVQLQLWCHGR